MTKRAELKKEMYCIFVVFNLAANSIDGQRRRMTAVVVWGLFSCPIWRGILFFSLFSLLPLTVTADVLNDTHTPASTVGDCLYTSDLNGRVIVSAVNIVEPLNQSSAAIDLTYYNAGLLPYAVLIDPGHTNVLYVSSLLSVSYVDLSTANPFSIFLGQES